MNKFKTVFFTVYATTALLFVGFSYLFIDPNFFYLKDIFTNLAFSYRPIVSAVYFLLISLLFIYYLISLKQVKNKNFKKNDVILLVILSSLLLFSYPAVLSYDIFNYLATARVTFFYSENPYMVMPVEFINDPMLLYTRAANKYALYGPFWILLSGIPYVLSSYNVLVQLFTFKLFVGMFYVGTVYLLYKLSKSLFVAAFFALNPLVLIEVLVGGHNDIVMIFLCILGFYLLKQHKVFLSVVFLFFSILIKYATLFLLPIWLYMIYKENKKYEIVWRKIWFISLLSMTIVFLLSPLREEIYPWYFVWVLPFVALMKEKKLFLLATCLSFGLLMYYVPYMYTGHYLFIWKTVCVIAFSGILFTILYVIHFFKNDEF